MKSSYTTPKLKTYKSKDLDLHYCYRSKAFFYKLSDDKCIKYV